MCEPGADGAGTEALVAAEGCTSPDSSSGIEVSRLDRFAEAVCNHTVVGADPAVPFSIDHPATSSTHA